MTRQPAIYVPHGGGPWPFMADPNGRWASLAAYLEQLPKALPQRPDAIAVVTAHWEAAEFTVASGTDPALIYDYYGFPEHTYDLKYPAPGAPKVAERIAELAGRAGIPVQLDDGYGWDHGVFVPLAVSWPDADVPVAAISLKTGLDPDEHVAFGEAIAAIRDQNVVVIGSGLSVHDLRFNVTPAEATAWDRWLEDAMALEAPGRRAALGRWSSAPGGRAAHPREEHLLPAMVVAGAGGDDQVRRSYNDTMFGLPVAGYTIG